MKRLDQAIAETRAQLHTLRAAMDRLDEAIARADRVPPCRRPGPNLWLSECAEDRADAARLCAVCPVLAECRTVAETEPSPTGGIWAGQDYNTRTARRTTTNPGATQMGTGRSAVGDRGERVRQLVASSLAEVDQQADPRVTRLRELAADPAISSRAGIPSPQSRVLRHERAQLVTELRHDDPGFWTTIRLAAAVGVSRNTIYHLLHDARPVAVTGRSR